MSIILTPDAYKQLRSQIPANTPVRLHATKTGGWSNTVEFELVQDEQVSEDKVYTFDDLNLLVNPFAEKHLEGKVVIDYKQNYGYVLKNSFEILAFGMKFKRK